MANIIVRIGGTGKKSGIDFILNRQRTGALFEHNFQVAHTFQVALLKA
ncbi:hypothetical protein [Okeania hirsuta]|nr:hypothetical protein [Okeania hirsuta]